MPPAAVDYQTQWTRHHRSKPRLPKKRHVAAKANNNPGLLNHPSCWLDNDLINNNNNFKYDFTDSSNGFVFGSKVGKLKYPDFDLDVEMKQNKENNDRFVSKAPNNGSDFEKTQLLSGLANGFGFKNSKQSVGCREASKNNEFGVNLNETDFTSGLSNGFVFGKRVSFVEKLNLIMKTKQCTMSSKCEESNKIDEFGKGLSGGFAFGTGKSCSNMRKKKSVRRNPSRLCFAFVEESDKKIENVTSETKENAEVGCKREDGIGFGFGGNRCELGSTFDNKSSQSNQKGGETVPVDKMGFVFGSASTSCSSKETVVKSELKLQKEKAGNGFVFGTSGKGNASSRDFNELGDEISKPNNEGGRSNTSADNDNQYFVFGSKTCASGLSTTDKLSDEMRKLSFTESREKGKFGDRKEPFVNSCASSDPVFVFGSSGKSSTRQGRAKTEGVDIRIINENGNRKGAVSVSDEQIKLGRLFDTFEEKPPTNANEKSSNDPSVGISSPKPLIFPPVKSSAELEDQVNDDPNLKKKFSQSFFPADLFNIEAFSMGRVEGKDNFSLRTPSRDGSNSFAENISTGFTKYPDCSEKSRSTRNKKWKKLGHKSRKVDPIQQHPSKNIEGSQQNAESPGHFSPMDFSPYHDDQCVPSTNVTSSGLARDEAAEKGADSSRGGRTSGQANGEFSKNFWERFAAEYPFEQAETVGRSSRPGQFYANNDDKIGGAADATFSKISNSNQQEKECRSKYGFPSSTEGNEGNFGFISKEDNVSVTKCRSRRRNYRKKVGSGPKNIDPSSQVDSSYLHSSNAQNKERNTINSQWVVKNNVKGDEEHRKQRSTTARMAKNNVEGDEEHIKEAQNACEKWRIRGNQAYEKGNSSKAEEYYTKGINSIEHMGSAECSIEPLVLCYSNRAAARMLGGRMREALSDCLKADSLDPSFQKVQLRAANCHLALGQTEEACQYFNKSLESRGGVCLDRRIAIEAASGLQKAQTLASCLSHCAELLRQKTSTAANSALESISTVFATSSYSEKLLELKGEALFMLQRYKEVIQLCEQTLGTAEKNLAMVAGAHNSVDTNAPNSKNSTILLWKWCLMSKSYFYLGRLELALDFLEKQEVLAFSDDRSNTKESSFPFADTVRELLQHKSAGNRAFQSGKHTEAVEHYSAAVSGRIESRPFAAVCFCNRAAAQQGLGQLSDAISDCSIAIALDGTYSKAVSRRATLHEKIRDYVSATSDLKRLISLLKEQSRGRNCGSTGADTSSGNNAEELRLVHSRLLSIEEKAKKGLPLDHYLILGVKSTDEASELKKAYRRAALRHHPDKAGQFFARADNGGDGRLWKEICEEIQNDADRLFK